MLRRANDFWLPSQKPLYKSEAYSHYLNVNPVVKVTGKSKKHLFILQRHLRKSNSMRWKQTGLENYNNYSQTCYVIVTNYV